MLRADCDVCLMGRDMCLMGRDTVIYGLLVDPSNCLMLSVLMLEVMS